MTKKITYKWLGVLFYLAFMICVVQQALGGGLKVSATSGTNSIPTITTTNFPDTNSLNYYILLASIPPDTNLAAPITFVGSAYTTNGLVTNMVWGLIGVIPPATNVTTNFYSVPAGLDTNTNNPLRSNTYISSFSRTFAQGTNPFIVNCQVNHFYTTNSGTNTINISCQGTNTNSSPEWSATLLPSWITRDGKFIGATNSNNVVAVGQQMVLACVTAGPFAITNNFWGIPGTNFKSYNPNITNANYVPLTNSDYTNNYINYYWSYTDSNTIVTDSVTIYGQTVPVLAKLNVQRPVGKISVSLGSIGLGLITDNLYYTNTIPYLYDGITGDATQSPGITFNQSITEPANFTGGTNEWVQIIVSDVDISTYSGSTPYPTNTLSFGLDHTYPYPKDPGTNGTEDSPNDKLVTNQTSESRSFSASMYLMWKPPTNSVGGDNVVYVPLRSIGWKYNASATNPIPPNADGWSTPTGSNTPLPIDSNAPTEPNWTNNSTNEIIR